MHINWAYKTAQDPSSRARKQASDPRMRRVQASLARWRRRSRRQRAEVAQQAQQRLSWQPHHAVHAAFHPQHVRRHRRVLHHQTPSAVHAVALRQQQVSGLLRDGREVDLRRAAREEGLTGTSASEGGCRKPVR